MPASWRVVSEIYEAQDYPIVVHIFFGQSEHEALDYYLAHQKTDSFLRECAHKGSFQGKFACTEHARLERLERGQWTRVG